MMIGMTEHQTGVPHMRRPVGGDGSGGDVAEPMRGNAGAEGGRGAVLDPPRQRARL